MCTKFIYLLLAPLDWSTARPISVHCLVYFSVIQSHCHIVPAVTEAPMVGRVAWPGGDGNRTRQPARSQVGRQAPLVRQIYSSFDSLWVIIITVYHHLNSNLNSHLLSKQTVTWQLASTVHAGRRIPPTGAYLGGGTLGYVPRRPGTPAGPLHGEAFSVSAP